MRHAPLNATQQNPPTLEAEVTIQTQPPVVDRPRTRWPPRRVVSAGEQPKSTPAPPMPGRRNPKWIALGVVALCLGALLSYVIYARVAHQAEVVAIASTVHRGETVKQSDLTTVNLSSEAGVKVVLASELSGLVGRKAVYDLVAGSLLPVGAVADVVEPQTGHAVVGIRLVSGRAPSGLLPAGSPLRLIALPPSGADPGFNDQYVGRTIISRQISQVDGADGASVVLNVDVPADQAPVVALLAAQERLAVVRDADR
jgi:hypothetical protein